MRPRLLALDLDGTLLDPFGDVTDSVREAVAAARERGLAVVLCTGRRFRTALPAARALSLSGPIVVHNGVLVKDIATGRTELDCYLPADLYTEVLAVMRELGPPLVYVDAYHEETDIVTDARQAVHAIQGEYLGDNADFIRVVDDLGATVETKAILMSAMAELETEAIAPGLPGGGP